MLRKFTPDVNLKYFGVGLSLISVGAGILYLLYGKDDDDEEDVLRRSADQIDSKNRRYTVEFEIPEDKYPAFIGRGGSNVRSIQDKTNTVIKTKDDVADKKKKIREVTIRGTIADIEIAKATITEFLYKTPSILTEEIFVPFTACGRIIGRGGANIRTIQSISKAKVNIDAGDSEEEDKRKVTIRGTSEQIKMAKSLIETKVQEDRELRLEVRTYRKPRSPMRQTNEISLPPTEHLADRFEEGYIEVFVSAMKHPGQFWIQRVGDSSNQLDKLTERMNDFYNIEENREILRPKASLEVGATVALQYKDSKWYRGLIRDVRLADNMDDNIVDVFYMDFGDDEKKKQSEVYSLKAEFLVLRCQAIECGLAGVKSKDSDGIWSEDASDEFDAITLASTWRPVMVKPLGYRRQERGDRGTSPVPLVDIRGDNDINVANTLIEKGFAEKSEEQTNNPGYVPAGAEFSSDDDDDGDGNIDDDLIDSD